MADIITLTPELRRLFSNVKPNEFMPVGGMIPYFVGEKGAGKTTILTCMANIFMLPPVANKKVYEARKEAKELMRYYGFKKAVIPKHVKHLVYSDITITTLKDQGYLPRKTWELDIDRLGVPSEDNPNIMFLPYGATIIIDELLEKFDNRDWNKKGKGMSPNLRKLLQICRHRDICIMTGCLRASASDLRFRQMSNNIFLILDREDDYQHGEIVKTRWYCLEFASSELCDEFERTHDPRAGIPRIFEHKGYIYDCVNSYAENKQFLQGMQNKKFEFKEAKTA